MADAFTDGAALVLGVLLVAAGALKLARPTGFGHAVGRLLPKRRDLRLRRIAIGWAGPVVGTVEVLVGAGLLLSARLPSGLATAAALAAAGLYVSFVAVVAIAMHEGAACGCFDSFSDSAAGRSELARAVVLALLALWVAAQNLAGETADPIRIGAAVVAVPILAAVAAISAGVAARSPGPQPGGTKWARIATASWSLMGRVTSKLEGVKPGAVEDLSPDEARQAVEAARMSPSVRAFQAWLGPRANEIDWAAASAVRVRATVVGRPGLGVLVTPPRRRDLSVMVSLQGDPSLVSDSVVIASLDGRPVSVVRGVVQVAGERTDGA